MSGVPSVDFRSARCDHWLQKDIHETRDEVLLATVDNIAEAESEREAEFTLKVIPRMREALTTVVDDMTDRLLLSENSNVAICNTDYWLNTLWHMMLALLRYLEGDEYTIGTIRLYANGLPFEGYGVGTDTAACLVDEDGNWVVKDTWRKSSP